MTTNPCGEDKCKADCEVCKQLGISKSNSTSHWSS